MILTSSSSGWTRAPVDKIVFRILLWEAVMPRRPTRTNNGLIRNVACPLKESLSAPPDFSLQRTHLIINDLRMLMVVKSEGIGL